ncbi:MAG: acyl-CoA dehydrogenase family protein [Acidobacteriota bacterium]
MQVELSAAETAARGRFREFVRDRIAPYADRWDRQEKVPRATIDELRQRGYLGAPLSEQVGGRGMDAVTYGLLTEELARGCSSVRSLLTVHDMVALTLARWGSPRLKAELLPRLARGERLGALAVSEPNVGSDAASVETEAREEDGGVVLRGRKKWTTFGQIADVFLVLARGERGLAAYLVEADAPGLSRRPIAGMTGTRASLLAEIELDDCRIPADHLLGRVGFGLSHVIGGTALDHGRYSVAWGSVGIAQACLDACLDYTAERQQGGAPIRDHQLVRRQLTEMIASTRAARLLCYRAAHLRRQLDPGAAPETWIAKYFASRTAVRAANAAVQLHGAYGLSESSPVGRYLRDAKVTEVIEGSTQIQQIFIPEFVLPEL